MSTTGVSKADRQRIRDYYEIPGPFLSPMHIFIGILLVLGGIAGASKDVGFLGVAVVGAGIMAFLPLTKPRPGWTHAVVCSLFSYAAKKRAYASRPSGEWIDEKRDEDLSMLSKKGIDKLSLDVRDLVRESIVLWGPIYWKVEGLDERETRLRRKGENGFRYPCWQVTVIVFTQHHLGCYQCFYNSLRDSAVQEQTEEFFYKDVVSVKTFSDSHAFAMFGGNIEESFKFRLAVSSGDEVTHTFGAGELKMAGEARAFGLGEAAVRNVRAMLREKKAS